MKVKIFTTTIKPKQGFLPDSTKSPECTLDEEMNVWLSSKPDIDIKNIMQSQSGGSWMPATLTITIWYQ